MLEEPYWCGFEKADIGEVYLSLMSVDELPRVGAIGTRMQLADSREAVQGCLDDLIPLLDAPECGDVIFLMYFWRLPVPVAFGKGSEVLGKSVAGQLPGVVKAIFRRLVNTVAEYNSESEPRNQPMDLTATNRARRERMDNDRVRCFIYQCLVVFRIPLH